jgi:hypothetical protein
MFEIYLLEGEVPSETRNFVIPLSSSENTPSQHADIDLPDTK